MAVSDSSALLQTCRDLVGEPRVVSRGLWVEKTNSEIRDALRAQAGSGWQVFADIDEFHFYPSSLPAAIDEAENAGQLTIEGLLFDRVSRTGEISAWDGAEIDRSYPLGGFFTHLITAGDSRKVMAARSGIPLGSGNHWAPGLRIGAGALPPLPVHHFKWRAGCLDYLEKRATAFRDSTVPSEVTMRRCCEAVFDHLSRNSGRIAVDDPRLAFRACSLTSLPPEWSYQAAQVSEYWWRIRWQDSAAAPLDSWLAGPGASHGGRVAR
ncbi:MAG TPA: hypothetical protein VN714_17670 [Trebonia sp.]|nr:hypothetical protein [Trebonia sp.]